MSTGDCLCSWNQATGEPGKTSNNSAPPEISTTHGRDPIVFSGVNGVGRFFQVFWYSGLFDLCFSTVTSQVWH